MPQAAQVVLIFGVIARTERIQYSILGFDFGTFGRAFSNDMSMRINCSASLEENHLLAPRLFPERSLNPIPYSRFKYISVYVF